MILRLYHSNKTLPADIPANKGFDNVPNLLRLLARKEIASEIIDVDLLPDEEVQRAYARAVVPSVSRRFGIRRVFGSRRKSGQFFGRQVPALLVYEDDADNPSDVYPRDDWQSKMTTIEEYLYDMQTEMMLGKH
jgi:hypothetical protein